MPENTVNPVTLSKNMDLEFISYSEATHFAKGQEMQYLQFKLAQVIG